MDYAAWVDRLRRRISSLDENPLFSSTGCTLEPPASKREVWVASLKCLALIPKPVRRFWETASAGGYLGYVVDAEKDPRASEIKERFGTTTIFGGIEWFCPLDYAVRDYRGGCRDSFELAKAAWEGETPLIRKPFPIGDFANGDYLVLDLHRGSASPVFLMSHDGGSFEMAPSFDAFLERWERHGYLSPDSYYPWTLIYPDNVGLAPEPPPLVYELKRLIGLDS